MWARVENDRVAEITETDPVGRFHRSLTWIECSSEVKPGWRCDGEQCFPAEEISIEEMAENKLLEIDVARANAFESGTEFTFPGVQLDQVQIRPQDKPNLLAIAIEARDLKAAGESDPVIDFRAASNTTYTLTPNQAIEMTNAALAHVKLIYEKSWELKDAVSAALETQNREAIDAVSWS